MSDKHTAAQGQLQRYSLTYRNDFGDKYGADADEDNDGEWVRYSDVEAKIRESEGQAQTSAAIQWREFGDDEWRDLTVGDEKAFSGTVFLRRAAQLADSTAPGAPVDDEAEDFYAHACEVMEQFQAKRAKRGVEIGTEGSLIDGIAWLYHRLEKLELAAPTAQQSLTAGGAVPDAWRELAERCLSSMKSAVHFRKTGQGRPPEQTCLFEIQDLEKALAAAPLPQIQSDALEDPLNTKLPCDVVIGNMTIRKGVRLGTLVGKAQRDNARMRVFLNTATPEQVAAFNALVIKPDAAQQAIKPSVDNDGGVA